MADQIVLLGVKGGPSVRKGGAMPTSTLVQLGGKNIVVDCGIGCTRSIVETGVSILDIDAIYITHLHSDHLLELGSLLYTAWTTGPEWNVKVFGPHGIEDYWKGFLSSMSFDHQIRIEDEGRTPIEELVEIATFGEGELESIDGVHVSALRVDHPPVTECYALRFEHGGKSIVFSADTCYFPPLAEFAKGATILVHEAMLTAELNNIARRNPSAKRLREHLIASHTPAEDVGRIASAAMTGTLVLNHLVPADDPAIREEHWLHEVSKTWNGRVVVGHDGLTIPVI